MLNSFVGVQLDGMPGAPETDAGGRQTADNDLPFPPAWIMLIALAVGWFGLRFVLED